jgi:hypothetical protein
LVPSLSPTGKAHADTGNLRSASDNSVESKVGGRSFEQVGVILEPPQPPIAVVTQQRPILTGAVIVIYVEPLGGWTSTGVRRITADLAQVALRVDHRRNACTQASTPCNEGSDPWTCHGMAVSKRFGDPDRAGTAFRR